MGIDYGTKRVGIAISDEEKKFAFPREVVPTMAAHEKVLSLIADEFVSTVVIGQSINRDGSDNPLMHEIRDFAQSLVNECEIEVVFVEERYTSLEAKRQFESKLKTRKPQKNAPVDDSAAALILQSYIDRNRE